MLDFWPQKSFCKSCLTANLQQRYEWRVIRANYQFATQFLLDISTYSLILNINVYQQPFINIMNFKIQSQNTQYIEHQYIQQMIQVSIVKFLAQFTEFILSHRVLRYHWFYGFRISLIKPSLAIGTDLHLPQSDFDINCICCWVFLIIILLFMS